MHNVSSIRDNVHSEYALYVPIFYVSTRLIGIPAHQTRSTQIWNTQHTYTTLCRIKIEYRLKEVDLCYKIGENWLYRMRHICRPLTLFNKKLLFRCTRTYSIRFILPLSTFVSPSIQRYKYAHLFPSVLCFAMQTLLQRRSPEIANWILWKKHSVDYY